MNPYPAILAPLIAQKPLQPLGPGQPHADKRAALAALALPAAFAPHVVRDERMARACLAGLWLAYDFLDESHSISQDLRTVEGSYWHAIMHRREPDYGNSKYWFRRVGTHPIFEDLREEAARLAGTANQAAGAFLAKQARWDPFAFVDLCETSADEKAPAHELCRQIQRVEWDLLFAWCCQGVIR